MRNEEHKKATLVILRAQVNGGRARRVKPFLPTLTYFFKTVTRKKPKSISFNGNWPRGIGIQVLKYCLIFARRNRK